MAEGTNLVLADITASVTELKKNPMGIVQAGEGFPVAILNRNQPAFYCVPASTYEAMLEQIDDLKMNALANERQHESVVKVSIDAL